MTTTAVALAAAWPTDEGAVVIEADPAGGRLAGLGVDDWRGLGSLSESVAEARVPVRLSEHLQTIAAGVLVVAAPRDRNDAQAALTARVPSMSPALRDRLREDSSEVVFFADCGRAEVSSLARPIMTGADATVLVLGHPGGDADVRVFHEIRRWCPNLVGVVLIGAERRRLLSLAGVPVLGMLPRDDQAAIALLESPGTEAFRLIIAARPVATALHECLHRPPRSIRGEDWRRGHRSPLAALRRRHGAPTVYGVHEPPHAAPTQPAVPRERPAADPAHDPTTDAGAEVGEAVDVETAAAQTVADHPGEEAASASRAVARESARPGPVVEIELFGPLRVRWGPAIGSESPGRDITASMQPRSRELLALLATHPEGMSRDELIAALWHDHSPRRPVNALSMSLHRLRETITTATEGRVGDILADDPLRYRLDPARVSVDYWEFAEAVRRRRISDSDPDRAEAARRVLDLAWRGTLAADAAGEWVLPLREAVRRDALIALGSLAGTLVDRHPRETLDLLEKAIEADPYNEQIYQDILRLHARMGETNAIDATFELLTRRLAEIREHPSHETRELAQRLKHRPAIEKTVGEEQKNSDQGDPGGGGGI
ncbi:BTAD domain-containing putative transcriptional regulator [Nocardia cyriacigeorgica]|uniref:BTAD domain-containing putative transcriptional regulator n=1 Tax=Nocardia cyriacigeorgica TaxID=135487 RepID=UPI0014867C2B|nr:BTAD domain-containing putative transcriptional regulator [Nocardia cyriacigeorgica]